MPFERKHLAATPFGVRSTNAVGFRVLIIHGMNGLAYSRFKKRLRTVCRTIVPVGGGYDCVPTSGLAGYDPYKYGAIVCLPKTEMVLPPGIEHKTVVVPGVIGPDWTPEVYDEAKGFVRALFHVALYGPGTL